MQKVFEKILERLEELSKAFPTDSKDEYFRGNGVAYKNSKDIVEQMYKEHNNGWIPCNSDKKPKENEVVELTFFNSAGIHVGEATYKGNAYFYVTDTTFGYYEEQYDNPIAWQPLLKPCTEQHDIKILPQYYEDVISGKKSFEIRKNDRDYKVGDVFVLREWDSDHGYTGRSYANVIKYVLKDCPEYGLQDGYCIFGWK